MLVAGPAVFLAIGLAGFAMAGAFLAYPAIYAKLLILDDRGAGDAVDRGDARPVGGRSAGTGAAAMSAATLFGLCGAALVGLGLFGLIVHPQPLRKILAFNLIGGGVFLLFGVVARRGAAAGFGGDPVPQALVITGIVVAFAATALAVALVLRLFQRDAGTATLAPASNDRRRLMPNCPRTRGRVPACSGDRLPVAGVLLAFSLGGRHAERVAVAVMPFGLAVAVAIAAGVWRSRQRAAIFRRRVGAAARRGVAGGRTFRGHDGDHGVADPGHRPVRASAISRRQQGTEARAPLVFWTLLLAVWAAINAVFLGADLFNLYVALELLTFAAVPLVCLDGRAETLRPHCAICSLRCSARSSICSGPCCSTALTARSTSSCYPAGSMRSRSPGWRCR